MTAPSRTLLALTLTTTVLATPLLPMTAASAAEAHPDQAAGHRDSHSTNSSARAAGAGHSSRGAASGSSGTSGSGRSADPAGNNGTVKVDGVPVDGSRRNEPHVGCEFALKFFGFDAGQTATITFTGQAPTKAGTLLTDGPRQISDDAAGGGQDADAVLTYSASQLGLSSVTPARQGWHVKVSVDVAGAPGGAKQKVFWLSCPTSAPTAGGGTTSTGGTTSGGGTTGTTSTTSTTGASSPTTSGSGGGAGTAASPAALPATTSTAGGGTVTALPQPAAGTAGGAALAPTYGGGTVSADSVAPARATAAGSSLPFTGDQVGAAAALGLGALVTGAGALLLGRRRTA